jgi:hypothetical protein
VALAAAAISAPATRGWMLQVLPARRSSER